MASENCYPVCVPQLDNISAALMMIANKEEAYDASMSFSVWKKFVDAGLVKKISPVGSQLTDTWYKDDNTHYDAPWDVVHVYSNGDVALQQHYAMPDGVPFDEAEAIYYATGTEGAGTYHIGIGANYTAWSTEKAIQITTNVSMAENDQLVIDCGYDANIDPTNGRSWYLYAAGSTTVKDSGTTTNGAGGTSLGSTSASGTGYTNGRVNAPQRIVYGYNRYSQSAIRQYLNSRSGAGAWWSLQNPWDRPPAVASTIRGWAAGMTDELYDLLEAVPVVTAINTVEGASETTETTYDKIFLPSLQEMYIAPQLADAEGAEWDYYKNLAEQIGLPGKFQQFQTYPILIKHLINSTTAPVYVWMRSALRGGAYGAWVVYTSGYVNYYYCGARWALRGCPSCKIKKSA